MALTGRHILMTADAVGGVWQYACDLAGELTRGGDRITLAVVGPPPGEAQRRCLDGVERVRLIETGLTLDWMCADAAELTRSALGMARLAAHCRADLFHCNSPALIGAADFPVPVIAAAHGCITTWWQAARGGTVDPALRWHGALMRRGLEAAAAVVAPSASFAATLQATYGLRRRPLVIHNGRPPSAAHPGGSAPMNAALTAGRVWDPVKNGALCDKVAAMIDLRFLAAGALRSPQGEEIALSHMVALGELPGVSLAELLARRPIFVAAATFEPFGLAVLEAASAGCALVLSDIATFRELWADVALFCAPDDAEGFAHAIMRLRDEPALRDRLGEAARARSRRYTPQANAQSMRAVYGEVLEAREVAA